MSGTYELKRASNGQFLFNLKAGNGEVILTSERYTTRASAENGIASVQTNSPLDERYERRTSKADEPYFVLKAANHVVGRVFVVLDNQDLHRVARHARRNATYRLPHPFMLFILPQATDCSRAT